MPKGIIFDNDYLKLVFQGVPIANLADNAGSSPLTNLYVSLHTLDPTSSGNQSTNEISYTGYARVPVARTSGGWTVTGNVINPANPITFPACTAGSASAAFWVVGTAASGTGKILWTGAVFPTLSVTTATAPQLSVASTVTET